MQVTERVVTIAIPGAAPAGVLPFDVQIPDNVDLIIEAWGALNGIPVILFEGNVTLADAQQRLASAPGLVDCLMAIPSGGIGRREAGPPLNKLTLFWESTEGTPPANVTVRIVAHQKPDSIAREARIG